MKHLKILFVEDNQEDIEQFKRRLRDFRADNIDGIEFFNANQGDSFRQMLGENLDIDIILLDCRVPGISAEEALVTIRKLHPEIPVIILTGSFGDDQAASVACQYGAADYILKDRPARLVSAVEKAWMRRQDALKQKEEERLKIEQRQKQIKAQRLELLGFLLAGVAHDMNNMLGGIAAGAELLRRLFADLLKLITVELNVKGLELVEESEHLISLIHGNAMRGGEMVKQMTAFAKGSEGSPYKVVTAEYLLTEIGRTIREKSFATNLQISSQTDVETGSVKCDTTQLYQVFLNLCVNARDAMPNGGDLHLGARNIRISKEGSSSVQPYVMFTVRDTGQGIPQSILPHVFEPFYTTKKGGNGTGLGLHIVSEILKDHGGDITVNSEPGVGTTFSVYLPLYAKQDDQPREIVDGTGKTIVLVDDEQLFRTAIAMHLDGRGFKTMTAGHGPEALAYFRTGEKIDLLITDLFMPIMCGREIVRNLRAQGFHLPVIFLSGIADLPEELEGETVLKKPVPIEELLKTIKRVLAAGQQNGEGI
jgi:signal transduction histidine kinase